MTVSDEQLMAWIDGELDADAHATLDARLATDADLARRHAAQLRLRAQLRDTFDPILSEPVPQRLRAAVAPLRRRRVAPLWFASAASLAIGLVLGPVLLAHLAPAPTLAADAGRLTAGGVLAEALSTRLAADPPAPDGVQVGISFLARSGEYCRTFSTRDAGRAVTGLACREGETWRVPMLEATEVGPARADHYAQAATALPPELLQAIESRQAGDALDAAGEAAARAGHWQHPAAAPPR